MLIQIKKTPFQTYMEELNEDKSNNKITQKNMKVFNNDYKTNSFFKSGRIN